MLEPRAAKGFHLPSLPAFSWDKSRVRLRRLRNEGFVWFLASVLMFAGAMILLRVYYLNDRALETAIQQELLATMGTPQEPSDSTSELGLIAAALVTINGHQSLEHPVTDDAPCATENKPCQLITALETSFVASVREFLTQTTPQANKPLRVAQYPVDPGIRPELSASISCSPAQSPAQTSFILPAQLREDVDPAYVSPRVARAINGSASLDKSLESTRANPDLATAIDRLVQVYFISPESVLRIWTSRGTNVCGDFNVFRLWAAQNYFTHFWDNPGHQSYTTQAYIDYGGNGLVQTRCRAIYEPRRNEFNFGRLFGILCTDLKLSAGDVNQLRRNLFFSTALVSFSASPLAQFLSADTCVPSGIRELDGRTEPPRAGGECGNGGVIRTLMASSAALARLPVTNQSDDGALLREAIDMQPLVLDRVALEQSLADQIRHRDSRDLNRGPARVRLGDKDAFLLPVGVAPRESCGGVECRQAVLFYPRNPTLPPAIKWVGATGYLTLGAAIMLGFVGIRWRPRSEELRERLTLLRNLQVGVMQVDGADWILEANDRAEELVGLRLPKYRPAPTGLLALGAGTIRRFLNLPMQDADVAKIGFHQLISVRLREAATSDAGQPSFEELSKQEIDRQRAAGQTSWYYARLVKSAQQHNSKRRWLRVSATPIMLAHPDRVKGAQLSNIFATVSEVPEAIQIELDRHPAAAQARDGMEFV